MIAFLLLLFSSYLVGDAIYDCRGVKIHVLNYPANIAVEAAFGIWAAYMDTVANVVGPTNEDYWRSSSEETGHIS